MEEEIKKSELLLRAYDEHLHDIGVEAICLKDSPSSLNHCRWMCQFAAETIKQSRGNLPITLAKANRWVGWIQCSLVNYKVFTLDECRAHASVDHFINSCNLRG